ncbi:hypothetical protein LP419_16345 [Massilia sp. H-1]|nr:hypothetical protein LP419_16345 [Massilia sp. H-1]
MGAGADHRPAPRAGAAREHGRQQPKHRISSAPGPAMQVQLVAAPVAPPVPDSMPDLAPAAPELTEPPPPARTAAFRGARARRGRVLRPGRTRSQGGGAQGRDGRSRARRPARSGDALVHRCLGGSVTSIHFEGNQLTPAQQREMRAPPSCKSNSCQASRTGAPSRPGSRSP